MLDLVFELWVSINDFNIVEKVSISDVEVLEVKFQKFFKENKLVEEVLVEFIEFWLQCMVVYEWYLFLKCSYVLYLIIVQQIFICVR